MKVKAVRVDVLDISTRAGWWEYDAKSHATDQKTMPVYGVLVDRTDKFVVLAAAPNKEGGDWLNEVTIPAALVKRIRILEVTEV